jgi:hypothetical protein
VAKIKAIDLSELKPVKKPRQPSARQLAVMKREGEYARAIDRLEKGRAAAFAPDEEKLPTLRASLARVIARNERKDLLHLAIIGGVAYVALEPIPGARGPRRKRSDQSRGEPQR